MRESAPPETTLFKVFVSCSHTNTDWVRDRLVPVLKASGAEVIVDYEVFGPGGGVHRQMDTWQDKADKHVLVLSSGYAASAPCQREMARAIATDPTFAHHKVLPVRRDDTPVPPARPADAAVADRQGLGRSTPPSLNSNLQETLSGPPRSPLA